MCLGTRKPCGLKLIRYTAHITELNKYFSVFLGVKPSDKICDMDLNEIFLKSMPNIWSRQACVQRFYCESITFKESINVFECMEIAESIYKGVVEPSYKKPTRSDSDRAGIIRKTREESASSTTYSMMFESTEKHRKCM